MSLFLASSTRVRTHTHILQLILQPENLFKHFSEGLGIERVIIDWVIKHSKEKAKGSLQPTTVAVWRLQP